MQPVENGGQPLRLAPPDVIPLDTDDIPLDTDADDVLLPPVIKRIALLIKSKTIK